MRGVTARTLQRDFRRNYGIPPQSCLDNLRDLEAWKLVQQGMPKKEIVKRLGYKYASHLSRRLRKFRQAERKKSQKRKRLSRVAQG